MERHRVRLIGRVGGGFLAVIAIGASALFTIRLFGPADDALGYGCSWASPRP